MSRLSNATLCAAKIAFIALACTVPLAPRPALAQDLNPVLSGWFGAGGRSGNSISPTNTNYFVGIDEGLGGPELTRNFFVFDLTGITGPITGATLFLYNPIAPPDDFNGYNSPDATETYQLTGTTSTPTELQGVYNQGSGTGQAIFATLGTGTVYSSYIASSADNGVTLQLSFSPAGLAALNGAIGGQVGFGGQLTTITGETPQNLFAGTDPTGGNTLSDTLPIVLRITTTAAAPEPSALALLLPVLVVGGILVRRHCVRPQSENG